MSRVGSLNDEELAWLVAISTLPGAPPIGKTIRELLGYRRALRALARHARRLRADLGELVRLPQKVAVLTQFVVALERERDAARAALLELALAFELAEGDIHDGAERLGAALDAAFAIVDPSGERRGGN